MLIDKIIGVGEIAISDHRSAQPTVEMLTKLAAEARVGGLLGNKAGVIHLHVGEGKRRLELLFQVLEQSDIPAAQFVTNPQSPAHDRNRNCPGESNVGKRDTNYQGLLRLVPAS